MIVWIFTLVLHLAAGPVVMESAPFATQADCQQAFDQIRLVGLQVGWDMTHCHTVLR